MLAFQESKLAGLKEELKNTNWSFLEEGSVDEAQQNLTELLLTKARQFIPTVWRSLSKSSHSWMNEQCLQLIAAKRESEGTEAYEEKLRKCSEVILKEFNMATGGKPATWFPPGGTCRAGYESNLLSWPNPAEFFV